MQRLSTMDDSQSASLHVLHIPELLEAILLFATLNYSESLIDPNALQDPWSWSYIEQAVLQNKARGMRWTLCSASRVNRFWSQTINSSPRIQGSLFLAWNGKQDDPTIQPKIEFNALLVTTFSWGYFYQYQFPRGAYNQWVKPKELPQEDPKWRDALLHKDASWRRMYPVFPPAQDVEVEQNRSVDWESEGGWIERGWRKGVLDFAKEGLVMGMLFDVIETWQNADIHKAFNVYWKVWFVDPTSKTAPSENWQMANFQNPSVVKRTKQTALSPLSVATFCSVSIALVDTAGVWKLGEEATKTYAKLKSEGRQWTLADIKNWKYRQPNGAW